MCRKDKNLLNQIAKYTLYFFVFSFLCVILFFLLGKKSMLDNADGLFQQYVYFVDYGRLIRSFFKNCFIDHIYEVPMWDMTIGMGSDPFISSVGVTNYVFDPLYFLSAFTPYKYSEYVFNCVVMLKLYFSGAAFILFAFEKGYKGINAIAGSLVYVFSSTMFIIFYEQNFSFPFFIFPLLLLCADKVWKNKGSKLYMICLLYCVLRSFYFTYMMIIFLVVYCIIRFLCEDDHSLHKFFSLFGKFAILTVIPFITGIGLILPALINLSQLNRLKNNFQTGIIDLEIVKRLFSYSFTCVSIGGDAWIGVSSFVVVSAICFIVSKKKNTIAAWCISLCFLSLLFPFIGSVFNGFNAPTSRHIFALILCISYLTTDAFDTIKAFKGRVWNISLGISIVFFAICFFFIDSYSALSAFSLLITILLTGIINHFASFINKYREKLYLAVILISCAIIGYSCFFFYIGPTMTDAGTVYNLVFVQGGMKLKKEVNDSKYRIDTLNADFADIVMNSSMAAGINGYDFYHSNQNQYVEDYYSSLAILGNPMGFSHTGFRARCYSEILNACNYIARSEDNPTCIRAPYSYDYVKTEGEYSLYKANKGVSLVYFYDDIISNDSFMKLDPLDRETNLMYSMTVDVPKQQEASIVSDTTSIPFEIEAYSNISAEGNKIIVQDDGGVIKLKPESAEAGQISVFLSGLRSSNTDYRYRNAVVLKDADNKTIVADYSAQYNMNDGYYTGNDDVIFSFESVDEKIDTILLIFLNPGEYSLDDIRIYSRPYKQMEQTLNAFYKHADMDNITYDYSGNHLSISASTDSDRYLYIAIPYSEGWHAKVDGETTEIIRANIAFMAISLPSGNHTIEMTYSTPYLYAGWIISAVGTVLFFGYMIFEKKKNTRHQNASN
ncbi:MAG: YfhO family protein [Clostridiales bacterium]|nr:YfhO family protein [Clostridiales bacterium]